MNRTTNMNTVLAYVHDAEVSHSFLASLSELVVADIATGCTIAEILKIRSATGALDQSRNILIQQFLQRDEEWLFWLDTDMGFQPDALNRLRDAADAEERPIVGALCFTQKEHSFDEYHGFRTGARPTIFDKTEVRTQGVNYQVYLSRDWYPPGQLVKCDATGMACVLIHRSVFERVEGPGWYDRLSEPGGIKAGEDISFCRRVGDAGIPIHVHTGVRTSHLKEVWLSDEHFWEERNPPHATDRVLVIVPVLHRPQNAELFMRSLRATSGLCEVVAVADEDDILTIAAWQEQRATVLKGPEHTFAEKVNSAYRQMGNGSLRPPWVFITGDDVQFHPGWLSHAQWTGAHGYAVVGTNDLGNPRVMAGEHATHLLIRSDYIDEQGASWDGPGTIAHEGYTHWFVDDEIVTLAKRRGEWCASLGSFVEHMHPLWGKGADDATYAEGVKSQREDRTLYLKRLAENG